MASGGTFSHQVAIRWRDSDAFGHVNHATFLTYLEEGRDRFLEPAFGSPPVYVVVRIEMDLMRELPLGQREATVRVEVERIGSTSVVLDESLLDADGNMVARSRTTIVRWDEERHVPRPVSVEERAVLQPQTGKWVPRTDGPGRPGRLEDTAAPDTIARTA